MSKPRVILIGAGGHAHACIDVIEQHGQFEIAGLVGLQEEMHTWHLGYEVIAADAELQRVAKEFQYALIVIGQILTPDSRIHLYQQASTLGFKLPVIVAPSAHVSRHATIGEGSIVMHGAVVNAGARVGNNCIINTKALIEHDVIVGDHCHISTGAILNGNATVGSGSFIGSGSVIKQCVAVGCVCVVGMGLSVRHDLADQIRFMGDISS
ncbi:MAG: NeuD/PglB/VioB family sugar acetyltransferase [Betaproteobacteria bacterium]